MLTIPLETNAQILPSWTDINNSLQNVAYNLVVKGLGLLVWFAASLLDFAVNNFVIGFGNTFVSTGIGVAVDNTWIIIRDFVNLFFIFGFVYIGFKMILSSSDSNTRRWLVNIILAALLVNFSLFVVKFAIDVSNQLAAQIAVNGLGTTGGYTGKGGLFEVDLTSEFMARMGLSHVLSLEWADTGGAGWGYVFGSAALFLTAMFVFAAGGILLIIRFAVLNLFLVLSPIMFMSWVLPPIKDTMNRFWSELFGRAAFAPIYLLFIYFSLQIISGLQVSVGKNGNGFANPDWRSSFAAANKVSGGAATGDLGTLPFFVLICIFLALSITMADKLGMDFGGKAVSLGKSFERKIRGAVGSSTAGLAGVAGQQTLGRLARGAANNEELKNRAASGGLGGYSARMQLAAARKVADSSFDARRVGGVGKALGIGEGKKGGIETRIKDKQKKEEEFMKSLKTDVGLAESAKIKEEEKVKLEAERQGSLDQKNLAEDMQGENGQKSIEQLRAEIDSTSNATARKVAAGAMTDSEKAAADAAIRRKRMVLREKEEQETLQRKIAESNTKVASASSPQELKEAREEQERLNKEYSDRQDYGARGEKAKKRNEHLSNAEKFEAELGAKAANRENEIKYKNQIAHMETMARRAERSWDPRVTKESLENLQKKIGKDGSDMAKKDKENEAKGDLAKQLKELQDAESKGGAPATPPPAGDAH